MSEEPKINEAQMLLDAFERRESGALVGAVGELFTAFAPSREVAALAASAVFFGVCGVHGIDPSVLFVWAVERFAEADAASEQGVPE